MVPALPEAVIAPSPGGAGSGRNALAPRGAESAGKSPSTSGFQGELGRALLQGEKAQAAPGPAAEEGEAAAATEQGAGEHPSPEPEEISGKEPRAETGAGEEPADEAALVASAAVIAELAGNTAPAGNSPSAHALEIENVSAGAPGLSPLSSPSADSGKPGGIPAAAQAPAAAAGEPPPLGSFAAGFPPRSLTAVAATDGRAAATEAPPSPAAAEPGAPEGAAAEEGAGEAGALPSEEDLSGMPRRQAAQITPAARFEVRDEGRVAASSHRPPAETLRPESPEGRRFAGETAASADPHPAARTRTPADIEGLTPPAVADEATAAFEPAAAVSEPAAAAKRPLAAATQTASAPEPAADPAESPEAGAAGPRGLKAEAPISPRATVSPAAADRELPGMPSRSQVFDPIVQRASLQVRGGREEIRIELKPEFLGPVRMQIATASQAVSVRILAEVPRVRDWIEAGLAQLKSDLEQQGLRVEKLEVAVSADGREGSARREEFRGPGAFSPASQAGSALQIGPAIPPGRELAPGLRHAAAGRGRLDLFA